LASSGRGENGKGADEEGKAMDRKLTITVDVDSGREEIILRDGTGNSHRLKSILVTGGGVEEGAFYLFGWGSSADLGWALAEGYRYSRQSPRTEDKFYQRVFSHLTQWIAQFHGWALEQPMDPRVLLERWEAEDAAKAAEEADRKNTN
jgi:hypothetical protein